MTEDHSTIPVPPPGTPIPVVIPPAIGKIVLFHPASRDIGPRGHLNAAIVAAVWDDRMVNLSCLDKNGNWYSATSVTFVQPGDAVPWERYAEWPPRDAAVAPFIDLDVSQ